MRYFFICILSSIVFFACNSGISQSNIEKLNAFQSRIDSTLKDYAAIDSTKIAKRSRHYFEEINYFKNNFKDTVEKDLGVYIDRYYGLNKSINFMQDNYALVKKELKASQEQVKDLKMDATKGAVEKKYFERYFNLEKENFEIAKKNAEKMIRTYHKVNTAYERMSPKIDSIIRADKAKKEKESV